MQQSTSSGIDEERINILSLIKQCQGKVDIDNTLLKALTNEIKVYAPDRIKIVWKYNAQAYKVSKSHFVESVLLLQAEFVRNAEKRF